MLECFFKITQSLLPTAFGDIVHPGDIRLLERIQFFMQAYRGRCPATCRIFLLIASQSPIVHPTSSTSMLVTRSTLLIIQVQFGLVPAYHLHSCVPSPVHQDTIQARQQSQHSWNDGSFLLIAAIALSIQAAYTPPFVVASLFLAYVHYTMKIHACQEDNRL